MSTTPQWEKELLGFNDRGIVDLMATSEGTWEGRCRNCGEILKGLKHQFGHVGCSNPNGEYIKNDVTPEKLRKIISLALQQERQRIMEILDKEAEKENSIYLENAIKFLKLSLSHQKEDV